MATRAATAFLFDLRENYLSNALSDAVDLRFLDASTRWDGRRSVQRNRLAEIGAIA
jgi:hypothetical protein